MNRISCDWRYVIMCMTLGSAIAGARPIDLDDLYRISTASDVQLSADGEWIAYTLSSPDRDRDEETSDIWLARWAGGESLQLTHGAGSEHHPRFSPDSRYLAFLSDRADEDKGDQIWLLDRRGGEARQITSTETEISDFDWSPDGKRLVFVTEPAPKPARESRNPEPIVIDRYYFKEDIAGYLGKAHSNLFLLELATGDVAQLTDGLFDEFYPAWSPDGGHIAFVSKRGEEADRHNNWDIYTVEPKPGGQLRRLTQNPGADGDDEGWWGGVAPDWSSDGERLAYLHGGAPQDIWYALFQVGVIDAHGGPSVTPTSQLDRNTTSPKWSQDGKWLYFLLEDDQSVQLARVRTGDARIERLTEPGMTVLEFDIAANDRIVLVSSRPENPASVSALERGKLRPLSQHNSAWLEEVTLASAESIRFESADALEIHGMLMRPAAFDAGKRYPLIVRIHGGPVSQHQFEFDFEWQLFAAHGYAVVGANPRGSSGRGYEFQLKLFADWGHADVPDVLAAVDYLVAAGIADPDRLGVGGWSYGGILTNYVIATDTRFKAATSGAGMSNMLGGYGIDQYVREWEAELGKPWENPETWLRLSYPFLHADRISTPTLFLCGSLDFNVPLAASEQMYQALRSLGVPTQLVIYPEQYHSLDRVSFQYDELERYLDWYRRYLLQPGDAR